MDLKQNIDNTNELKNKVKLANTRIKETVIRGGGYDFKSLDKAPERIKKMIGNYNKIAILNKNIRLNMQENGVVTQLENYEIKFDNINFNPSKFFIKFKFVNLYSENQDLGWVSSYELKNDRDSFILKNPNQGENGFADIMFRSKTSKSLKLNISLEGDIYIQDLILDKIILIE